MTALATQSEPQTQTQDQNRTVVDTSDMVIKCAGLTKLFKDFWLRNRVTAVDHIDIEVYRGEVFGLLGPNGSGKSTTIKMILGLLNPTSGRIAVFNKPPSDVSIKKRIGYLPEESYLYRFLNARETLDYYGRLFHQDRRQRQKRIDMLLEMVGLDKAQRRPVGDYSKGMQRRIGLAQALINDPELLILDEPTTGLDPIGTRQVKDLILDLARPRKGKPGKTILLCSHLLSDVEDVCGRVAIMFGGKVRKYGTVDELLIEEGRTTLQTPALTPELIQKIEELLARHGQHIEKVEHPRQKLEGLFLDIVNQALADGLATSGAGMGGKTASFLTDEETEASGDAVIDRLLRGDANKPATAEPTDKAAGEPAARGTVAPTPPKRDEADASVLESLTRPKPRSEASKASGASPASAPPPKPAQPAVDDSVISSLIGTTGKKSDSGKPQANKPEGARLPAGPQTPPQPPSPSARATPKPKPEPEAKELPQSPAQSPAQPKPQAQPSPQQTPVAPASDVARQRPSSLPVSKADQKKADPSTERPDRDFLDALTKTTRPDDDRS
jgi:ABC-2 type transport system ATP-binding protein